MNLLLAVGLVVAENSLYLLAWDWPYTAIFFTLLNSIHSTTSCELVGAWSLGLMVFGVGSSGNLQLLGQSSNSDHPLIPFQKQQQNPLVTQKESLFVN